MLGLDYQVWKYSAKNKSLILENEAKRKYVGLLFKKKYILLMIALLLSISSSLLGVRTLELNSGKNSKVL